jgi:predicted cupin superfamily sugar epimerase
MAPVLLKPSFTPSPHTAESPQIQQLVANLHLNPHIEGGFFVETDRAPDTVPSPFPIHPSSTSASSLIPTRPGFDPAVRNSSTTIFYLLTPNGPQGGFHRNKARIVHTLHRGRGRYVIIHTDEPGTEKRVETFVVGQNVEKGERLQWIVEGGKFKATYLLPDEGGGRESSGLLISETVVPGFEFCDHDFLSPQGLKELVSPEKAAELEWLLSPLGKE